MAASQVGFTLAWMKAGATRPPEYYDGTYEYLKNIGLKDL